MYQVVETAPLPNGKALWVLDLKGRLAIDDITRYSNANMICKVRLHSARLDTVLKSLNVPQAWA